MAAQVKPLYIVSVNNTPQRAIELVAILIQELRGRYFLVHAANSPTIEGVEALLTSLVLVPDILICSSQWTRIQQEEVEALAKNLVPSIKTIAIPSGLNASKGGEAVVDFLNEKIHNLGLAERAQCSTCT